MMTDGPFARSLHLLWEATSLRNLPRVATSLLNLPREVISLLILVPRLQVELPMISFLLLLLRWGLIKAEQIKTKLLDGGVLLQIRPRKPLDLLNRCRNLRFNFRLSK
jgi:hypothetical protein